MEEVAADIDKTGDLTVKTVGTEEDITALVTEEEDTNIMMRKTDIEVIEEIGDTITEIQEKIDTMKKEDRIIKKEHMRIMKGRIEIRIETKDILTNRMISMDNTRKNLVEVDKMRIGKQGSIKETNREHIQAEKEAI